MLNPSKADENQLDPTVTRCKKRAEELGYGGFEVVNIFTLRSTNPKALYKTTSPEGLHNLTAISEAVNQCEIAICAWGGHGRYLETGKEVIQWLKHMHPGKAHYLKLNADGSPTHPLYLPYELKPTPWRLN